MKKRGIKHKVRSLVSLLSIGGILLITVISLFGLGNMRERTVEISGNLGAEAATGSKAALEDQALNQLQSLTTGKTEYADARMQTIISQTQVISNLARDIFDNPGAYPDKTVRPPLAENKGVLSAQILYAENAERETAEAEARKMANLNELLMQTTGANSSLITSQVGTESGFIIMGDTSADTKAGMEYLDPRERAWYINAKDAERLVWSDVVDDAFGRGLGIVCANPVYDGKGNFRGVVGVSALLTELSEVISSGQSSRYSFALDGNGQMIISPSITKLEDSQNMLETGTAETIALAEKMVAGESGVARLMLNGTEVYAAYAPTELLPWSICTVVSVDEILSPANNMSEAITEMSDNARARIDSIIYLIWALFGLVAIFSVSVTFIMSNSFSRRITDPIERLSASVCGIRDQNLVYESNITTGDEIEDLSRAFETMTKDLVVHINNLTLVTAEKERINSDLRIATDIQTDMLPKIFPPYSNRDDLHMSAFMQPAKEVGGDFYDFFFLDDSQTKIALVIADVSGKGVPAALFMVIAKILIKNNKDLPFDEILGAVNNLLCADNNSSMFVTTYYSVLDIETGRYTYVNAGHNPPVLYDGESKTVSYLTMPKTPPLAIFPNKKFTPTEITLKKGDALLLYTDGVTEAFNTKSEMYGTERLLADMKKFAESPVEDAIDGLYKAVKEFAGEEPQSDDITMLLCRYIGR